jgi:hypothetical protein
MGDGFFKKGYHLAFRFLRLFAFDSSTSHEHLNSSNPNLIIYKSKGLSTFYSMKLYEKLHDIQTKVKGLGKDKKSHQYSYVTGDKVLSIIRPLMDQHKLLLKPEILEIENERMDYKTKYAEKSEILTRVPMRFTWIDVETGDTDVCLWGANGQNDWEKGLGSALTYAERYFLLKYFHIATDEDDIDNPDRKPADTPAHQSSEPATPAKKPAPKAAPKADLATKQQIENIKTLRGLLKVNEETYEKQLVAIGSVNGVITKAQALRLIKGYEAKAKA